MADINLAELVELLNEFGIRDVNDLRGRLSDDGRASAAFHEGHQQGFKYAHTLQATMNECGQTRTQIADFEKRFSEVMKSLRSIEKKLKVMDK